MLKNLVILMFALLTASVHASTFVDNYNESALIDSCVWDDWTINVCWENPSHSNAQERGWVKDRITDTWEKHSDLNFKGWDTCTDGSRGIRIKIADNGPHTIGLGKEILSNTENRQFGMLLNFEFNRWGGRSYRGPNRKSYIESLAMHEFGHALAFTHEHHVKDTIRLEKSYIEHGKEKWRIVVDCTDEEKRIGKCREIVKCDDGINEHYKQGVHPGEISITRYDQNSIMNYCNNSSYNNRLSGLDLAGLTLIYSSNKDRKEAAERIRGTNDIKIITTYFLHAAGTGNIEVVKAFLDFEVDPDIQNVKGQTALMYASQNGHLHVVIKLLEYGGDHGILTADGSSTALIYAAVNGRYDVVEELLRNGADPDIQDKRQGGTALMYALAAGHVGAAEKLLQQYDADPNIRNFNDETVLMYASMHNHPGVVKYLLEEKKVDPDITDKDKGTALIYASGNGHHKVVKELLSKGADPDIQKSKIKITALMYAAKNGHTKVVKKLLKKGADPDIRNSRDQDAYMYAYQNGNYNIARIIKEWNSRIGTDEL